MLRSVRFSAVLLTAAVLVAGCTSTKTSPVAGSVPTASSAAPTGSSAVTAPAATGSPKTSRSPRATSTPKATPSPSASAGTPTATTKAATSTPSATHSPSPTATHTQPSSDPIVAGAYVFPIAGCTVSYGSSHHDYPATDIFAARGCHFLAATAGTIDEVGYTDTWKSSVNAGSTRGGLYVSLVGDDGVRYYGSHLSAIAAGISPGVRVTAGALLGLVGDSGDARGVGTHVHYGFSWPTVHGVWWVRRGWISPYNYLNSWRAHVGRSPSAAIAAAHAAAGDIPTCRVDC